MRGTKAKALRRQVYGDMSHRTREHEKHHHPQSYREAGMITRKNPTCLCAGLRRQYQDAKRGNLNA